MIWPKKVQYYFILIVLCLLPVFHFLLSWAFFSFLIFNIAKSSEFQLKVIFQPYKENLAASDTFPNKYMVHVLSIHKIVFNGIPFFNCQMLSLQAVLFPVPKTVFKSWITNDACQVVCTQSS